MTIVEARRQEVSVDEAVSQTHGQQIVFVPSLKTRRDYLEAVAQHS